MARTATLSELRTRARQRTDAVNSTFFTDSEINGYINDSIAELYDILIQKFGADYYLVDTPFSFTTVSGQKNYDLPSNFYKLAGVDLRNSGTGDPLTLDPFMFIERNRFNNRARRTARDLSGLRYRIIGNKIRFIEPDANEEIDLWYAPSATKLVNDSDTFDGINGWEEYVVIDVAIKMNIKQESETTELERQLQRMRQRIEEAADNRDYGQSERVTDVRGFDADDNVGVFDEFL